MKYEEAYRWALAELKELNIDEAELNTWFSMEAVSGISRGLWYVRNLDEMPAVQYEQFVGIIERLKKDEPLSYILGSRDFCGMTFQVDENVLIPRQDTENLVMKVVEDATSLYKPGEKLYIHDLCTGSGCIAISVKKLLEAKQVETVISASDISDGALKVACANARSLEADVNIYKSDMFDAITGHYDIIISNPPYIPVEQYVSLDKRVLDYEPKLALYGGEDGLSFYRIIAKEAKKHLKAGGRLYLEIGFDQGESVPKLLANEGFRDIKVYKDYSGLDRDVVAVMDGL